MNKKFKFTFAAMLVFVLTLLVPLLVMNGNIAVLNPKGWIGERERQLIIISTILMCLVVIPVFLLTLFIAWKYRADNKKAKYSPKWDFNLVAEYIWWGFPFLIILVLGAVTYVGCYELDPFRRIDTGVKPLKIQVVALQWKWLFIFPEQGIATVNYFKIPEKTPIDFEITSDAPMNSFWIPQLGGQIYAMSGMSSQLHLIASEMGTFRGASSNISGRGFAGMSFEVEATSDSGFENWVNEVNNSAKSLTLDEYQQLAKPSEYVSPIDYVLEKRDLYHWIVMKYVRGGPQNDR